MSELNQRPRGGEQSPPPDLQPAIFLNVAEAAALLRVSAVTLGRWRITGCGPPYRKFGRRVAYERSDLIAWADAQRRSSTSELSRCGGSPK